MPLDALGARNIVSLTDLLTEIGVTPIPMKDLEAHKAEQVRRHPPSMWLGPKPYATFGVLTSLGLVGSHVMTTGGEPSFLEMMFATGMGMMAAFAFMLVVGGILDMRRVKLRGKAEWIESHPHSQPMPDSVREVMRHVRDRLPTAHFIYGELVQRSQVLDPYLVVMMPHCTPGSNYARMPWAGQRACLAIWDDATIIRIAEITED